MLLIILARILSASEELITVIPPTEARHASSIGAVAITILTIALASVITLDLLSYNRALRRPQHNQFTASKKTFSIRTLKRRLRKDAKNKKTRKRTQVELHDDHGDATQIEPAASAAAIARAVLKFKQLVNIGRFHHLLDRRVSNLYERHESTQDILSHSESCDLADIN